MIDWITAQLPCTHVPLNSGCVLKMDAHGAVEWSTKCFLQSVGSYDARIQYKSAGGDGQGVATHLMISGNPVKFLQGHNVFGSDDLVGLVFEVFMKLVEEHNLRPSEPEVHQVRTGSYRVTRVDITQSFELPTMADVLAWLRAGEYSSRTRAGRPSLKGSTLYWGKTSKRWSIKAYSKGEEIQVRGHELPEGLKYTPIKEWASNKLRVELTLRGKQIDEHIENRASDLATQAPALYATYLEKIHMTGQLRLSERDAHELPRSLHSTYIMWLEGHDLRHILPKTTYYKHRQQLLMLHNIDIALHRENSGQSNVIPLIRVLEAVPVEVPSWAYEQGVIHVPTRHLRPPPGAQLALVAASM